MYRNIIYSAVLKMDSIIHNTIVRGNAGKRSAIWKRKDGALRTTIAKFESDE